MAVSLEKKIDPWKQIGLTSGSVSMGASTISAGSIHMGTSTSLDFESTAIATVEDVEVLGERLDKIEKRLCIISDENLEMIENFPALKDAYEHYKLIEKLVEGQVANNDN